MSWFKKSPPFDISSLPPRQALLAMDIWVSGSQGITVLELGILEHLGVPSVLRTLRQKDFAFITKRVCVTDRNGNLRKGITHITMVSWP
jgi:hypothetical protein